MINQPVDILHIFAQFRRKTFDQRPIVQIKEALPDEAGKLRGKLVGAASKDTILSFLFPEREAGRVDVSSDEGGPR